MVTTRRGAETGPQPLPSMSATSSRSSKTASSPISRQRTPPWLPTPTERLALLLFPTILVFGTIFSLLSPQTRSAPYDAYSQSHLQDPSLAPSYFARKSNLFNVVFVKRGWGWASLALVSFALTHPALGASAAAREHAVRLRVQAVARWTLATAWWFVVTQWFFGPALIDRGFRWTGGRCDVAQREVAADGFDADAADVFTAVACRAAGGRWSGGHDISGHVFLLVLGTAALAMEIGWPVARWSGSKTDERCVVMEDGAVKGASVEAAVGPGQGAGGDLGLGLGSKVALGVMGLNVWMLLMTAIYFHTWFEKFTGLSTAAMGIYAIYYVPRVIPAVRGALGLPGI